MLFDLFLGLPGEWTAPAVATCPIAEFAALRLAVASFPAGPSNPYEFIWFGAMDVTMPYKFIWFGYIHGPKPYECIGFGAMDVTKPYKSIWFGGRWPEGAPERDIDVFYFYDEPGTPLAEKGYPDFHKGYAQRLTTAPTGSVD